ncbi:MAG: radical SAM protein [Nitrososphaeria archaeon]
MLIRRRKKLPVHFRTHLDYLEYKRSDIIRGLKYYFHNLRIAKGVDSVYKTFTGPTLVQIDITNKCNNNCIACWTGSPYLEDSKDLREWKKQELSFDIIKKVMRELHSLGTRKLYFAGGGEPFLHPEIMQILKYAKKLGFECDINTNFTLLNKEMIDELVSINFDQINVSLWAASPEMYVKMHPNKNVSTFLQIKDNLKYLASIKRIRHTPHVNLYNVITSWNYTEIEDMARLGLEVEADSVQFVPVDPISGKTEFLILNEKQRKEVIQKIKKAKQIIDEDETNLSKSNLFILDYDRFITRMLSKNAGKGEYECEVINNIPCYAGWTYSRILANGDVNFCLKSDEVLGNIYKQSFKEIWNNAKLADIRRRYKNDKTKDSFFLTTNCFKTCDNIALNQDTEDMLNSLNLFDKIMKKII